MTLRARIEYVGRARVGTVDGDLVRLHEGACRLEVVDLGE